jgi:hypothetical protein
MKKAKRKFLKEGSSPNVVEKDYDDDGAFEENDAETKKIMKTGKMAPQPDRDEPKIKMRCGNKFAAGGLAAKKFLKFVKKGKYTDKTGKKIDIDKEAAKVKPEDLDLETMKTSTPTKMKNGGLVRSGKPKLAKKGWR